MSYDYLHNGNYATGFELFEWRWHPDVIKTLPEPYIKLTNTPVWRGESIFGKSILVQMEMGYGDVIQFYRFLPILKLLGASRIVVIQTSSLHNLLAQVQCIDAITNNDEEGDALTCDYWIGSMSLPFIVSRSPKYVKQFFPINKNKIVGSEGYLDAKPSSIQSKIGVNWESSKKMLNAIKRTTPEVLLELCGANCYSLNPEDDGPFIPLPDSEWKSDWSKTASHMKAMSAVVTVDTGTAHLAGALGVKCFVLLPEDEYVCWRWKNGVWYDSITTLRKSDWHKLPELLKGKK